MLTAKHPVVQLLLEKAHRDNLHEGTEYVRNILQQEYLITGLRNAWRKLKSRCFKCDGGSTQRSAWWTCVPIHPYRSRLLRTLWSEVPTTYFEEMVLPLHLSNNESTAHRSHLVHRVMSSCNDKVHCKTCLPEHHNQWQRNEFRWRS